MIRNLLAVLTTPLPDRPGQSGHQPRTPSGGVFLLRQGFSEAVNFEIFYSHENNIEDTSNLFCCLIRQRKMPIWKNLTYEPFYCAFHIPVTSIISFLIPGDSLR